MKKFNTLIVLFLFLFLVAAPGFSSEDNRLTAVISTSAGTINLRLFADKTPVTVTNFVNLVQHGYYDGLNFHRVIDNFMIQGGCPDGTGRGGPGYQFQDEFHKDLRHNKPGILSMANAGPGTNGSQFFITHVPTPWLDGKHSVFGEVISENDMAVVNKIRKGDKIISIKIKGNTEDLLKANAAFVQKWNTAAGYK